MQNTRLARSLKKGYNDHITEIAIIQDKLVKSTVKAKSNKRQKTTSKGQTVKERKEFFDQMLEKEIAAQETTKTATENRRLKKQASDKHRTSSAREAAAKAAAIIQSKIIHSKIQIEAAKRKKAVKKNNVGGKEKVKKSMKDKRLDAVEDNWDRMVQIVDDRKAAANKKKKESDASEEVAKKRKKQGGKNKLDDTQYEIQAIVGHESGSRNKKGIRLRIKWVGYAQTTLESVKDTHETACEVVDENEKKKYIVI